MVGWACRDLETGVTHGKLGMQEPLTLDEPWQAGHAGIPLLELLQAGHAGTPLIE
jgi:hypothetical protein